MPYVATPPGSRKYKLQPDTVLRLNHIEVRDEGRYYTTCPQCSAKRKPIHQKIRCLGVTRPDDNRVYWGCNHCGWTGPGTNAHGQHVPYHPPQQAPHPARLFSTSTRTIYNYTDHLRKVKVRLKDGKKVWWEHKAKGWWEPGTNGVETQRLLYRLVTAKKVAQYFKLPICIVEGEGDVDCLMHIGIPATCNAHGASEPGKAPKWYRCHSEQLAGWDIAIFNDNDEAGMAHANEVFRLSRDHAKTIRLMDHALHFGETKDISEWIRQGGTKADLLDFLEGAPEC